MAGKQVVEKKKVERVDVIVRGLLKMRSIGPHLEGELGIHDGRAALAPAARFRKCRKQYAERVQSHCFTEQMRVGRKVDGQIRRQMMAVPIQRGEEAAPKLFRHGRRSQMINPDPGKRAEGYFERAGPIDSTLKRILREPAIDLRPNLARKFVLSA